MMQRAAAVYAKKQAVAWHGALRPTTVHAARLAVDTIAGSVTPGVVRHQEYAAGKVVPARIERVTRAPGPLATLADAALLIARGVSGIPELAYFKDKVNFKHPHGGTFLAHQDEPAYPSGHTYVSVLVPLVPFTVENGTLEVADPVDGIVPMEELAELAYTPVELDVGDLLVFGGRVPHRSGANTSAQPRVGLYLTFSDAGPDVTAAYYDAKAKGIAGMSLNQVDFTGELLPPYTPNGADAADV